MFFWGLKNLMRLQPTSASTVSSLSSCFCRSNVSLQLPHSPAGVRDRDPRASRQFYLRSARAGPQTANGDVGVGVDVGVDVDEGEVAGQERIKASGSALSVRTPV